MLNFLNQAREWATSTWFDSNTRQEVQDLLDNNDTQELEDRFGKSLEFGTGGMRGIMGAGTNRLNRYTVRKATAGLASYLSSHFGEGVASAVIGYDSRNRSYDFACEVACTLAGYGIKSFVFQKVAPTPRVSFEILQRQAHTGIIITASHNPPEYNGYKVYWQTAGQVLPPHDTKIVALANCMVLQEVQRLSLEEAVKQGLIEWIEDVASPDYMNALEKVSFGNKASNAKLSVIYTPLHGTGKECVEAVFQKRNFQQGRVLPQQAEPDGNFTTLKIPNPEEPKAFELAISQAQQDDHLILANDPDADRVGVMVRHHGQWQYLNGNQIGALLLEHYLKTHQNQKGSLVYSLVSSPLLAKIAKHYQWSVIETLTGFKWIWEQMHQIQNDNHLVFGMEESHGYLIGNYCGDKDGIWAVMAFAEMTALFQEQGTDPWQQLQAIYETYGFHLDYQHNFAYSGVEGAKQMNSIMQELQDNPPLNWGGFRLQRQVDIQKGIAWNYDTQTQETIDLPESKVLVFELEQNARVIVRPSGTEPKIKFYVSLSGASQQNILEQKTLLSDEILKYQNVANV